MRYQLIIFDFDGTLADSFPFFLRTLNELAATHRFRRIEPTEVEGLRGRDARYLMRHVGLPAWRMPFVARDFIGRMARQIDRIELFAGVPELLAQLASQGVQVAIVSSNSADNVRRVLGPAAAGVQHYACGAGVFGKARKFRQVLRRSGVAAAQTLCVGDEPRDVEAAHAVGATGGVVTWGYTHPATLLALGRVRVFASVADIGHAVTGG